MSALLPCPLCGERAQLHSWEDDDVYLVACDHCDASTRHCSGASDATLAWNRRADDWMPIETAPRDGTEVLVYAAMPDHLQWADPDKQLRQIVRVTAWHPDAGWCVDELREASHWRPLPEGPR
jgi:Lar family restriction alleviation protein